MVTFSTLRTLGGVRLERKFVPYDLLHHRNIIIILLVQFVDL